MGVNVSDVERRCEESTIDCVAPPEEKLAVMLDSEPREPPI
jgi:hypothetical protein